MAGESESGREYIAKEWSELNTMWTTVRHATPSINRTLDCRDADSKLYICCIQMLKSRTSRRMCVRAPKPTNAPKRLRKSVYAKINVNDKTNQPKSAILSCNNHMHGAKAIILRFVRCACMYKEEWEELSHLILSFVEKENSNNKQRIKNRMCQNEENGRKYKCCM